MGAVLRALRRAIVVLGIVGTVGGAIGAAPAAGRAVDGPSPSPSPARTQLTLVVIPASGAARSASLTCEPPGGSHPDPVGACRDLAAAGGDFAELRGEPGPCPDVYDPVTALAVGLWRGRPVWYGARYGNACDLRVETGPVFALAPQP